MTRTSPVQKLLAIGLLLAFWTALLPRMALDAGDEGPVNSRITSSRCAGSVGQGLSPTPGLNEHIVHASASRQLRFADVLLGQIPQHRERGHARLVRHVITAAPQGPPTVA